MLEILYYLLGLRDITNNVVVRYFHRIRIL